MGSVALRLAFGGTMVMGIVALRLAFGYGDGYCGTKTCLWGNYGDG